MKIALVTDRFTTGGGLEHMYQITRYLPRFSYGIFARAGDAVEKFSGMPNVQVFPGGCKPDYIKKFKPDIIHIHHLRPLYEICRSPFTRPEVPVIYTLHGAHIRKYRFRKGLKNSLQYLLRYRLESYLFRRVDTFITVSHSDLHLVQQMYKITNATHIPNGVDRAKFQNSDHLSREDIRRRNHLPPDQFLCLTIARFDFAKGYDVLAGAIQLLAERQPGNNCRFVWIGEGDELQKIQRFTRTHGIADRIIFLPSFQPVREIMRACDAFILPSRWEGLPLVILEAGYCRLPVIASDAEANREIIRDRENGRLFRNQDREDLANILIDLPGQKSDLKKLGETLRQDVIQNYDLESSMEKLGQIYHQMCKGKGS